MIGVDIDGVLANFSEGYSAKMREIDPAAPLVSDYSGEVKSWDWESWYWPERDRDYVASLLKQGWEAVRADRKFWKQLSILDHAGFGVVRQLHRNTPMIFITARSGKDPWGQTVEWFSDHGVREPLVVVLGPGETKVDVCKRMRIETLIDDAGHNAEEVHAEGIRPILIDYPYNEYADPAIERASTLIEALQMAGVEW